MKYRIRHITEYTYGQPVSLGYNRAHLIPRSSASQTCLSSLVRITPLPSTASQRTDYFGNQTYHFALEDSHKALTIDVTSQIEVSDTPLATDETLDSSPSCQQVLDALAESATEATLLAREFVLDSPMIKSSDTLKALGEGIISPETPLLVAARALTSRIFNDFKYDPDFTTVATPLDEVLEHKRGVCQDFAHLAIGCLRSHGFAARYISGYLETLPPPGQEKLVGSDASHAWFEIYIPDLGWIPFDPTNDNIPGNQHLVTAWGRDYSDVTPLRGVIFDGGGAQTLSVSVDVARLD